MSELLVDDSYKNIRIRRTACNYNYKSKYKVPRQIIHIYAILLMVLALKITLKALI